MGHLGREKCKHRARQVVFWPQMNQDIDNIVSNCEICQKYQHKELKEPLKPYPVATRPWQVVGTDLFEVDKKDYVVLVDAYSSYPELGSISIKSIATVTKAMKSVFARHGNPETVVSDNGPSYDSSEFSGFSEEWGFSHETSTPEHPSSNGPAEKAVQTVKNIIKKSAESIDDMQLGLLAYRSTPLENQKSPVELGRILRTNLSILSKKLDVPKAKEVVKWRKNRIISQKFYHDGKTKSLKALKPR